MVKIETTLSPENFYDENRDVIVIDEKLREYPEALEMVLLHELKHAMIENKFDSPFRKFLEHSKHGLKTDIKFAFSNKECYSEFRKYNSEDEVPFRSVAVSFLRSVWASPLYMIMEFRALKESS